MPSWKGNDPPPHSPGLGDLVARLRALETEAQSANVDLHLVLSWRPDWLERAAAGNVSQVANLCDVVIAACERAIRSVEAPDAAEP